MLPPRFFGLRSGSRITHMLLIASAGTAGLLGSAVMVSQAQNLPSPASQPARINVQQEYQRRFERLDPKDVAGHYALAEWCREQKAYPLLRRQAQYVLKLEPAHENAKLLTRIAIDQLKQQQAQTQPEQQAGEQGDSEFLSHRQIRRLKFAEFLDPPASELDAITAREATQARPRPARGEEFLQVRFESGVLNDFLDQMSGHRDFDNRDDRLRFLNLSPTRQTQLIRYYTQERYEGRIEITNDPRVFQDFERVLPMILNGCGTSACHGGTGAEGYRLRTSRPHTEPNRYTNYLILTRTRKGNDLVINRSKPDQSLILQYGLPAEQSSRKHPERDIPVMYPEGKDDVRYRTILAWIESLRVPPPRAGVSLPGYPEPAPPTIGGASKEKANTPEPAAPK